MAHQTNVHTVHENFKSDNPTQKVVDPVCGMEMEEQASRHMVFRKEDVYFFCSRECKEKFIDPAFRTKKKAA
jgi:YHS domain-containing protein